MKHKHLFSWQIIFVHVLRCYINKYLLSSDEAQEPRGEEAIVDNERHLSVYEPFCSQFPESSFSPFNMKIHQRFFLLHPRPVLIKAKQTLDEDSKAVILHCKQWGCILAV